MADYITKDDLKNLIDAKSLGALSGIDKCLDYAETQAFTYIGGLYDTKKMIDEKTGDDGSDKRDPYIVMVIADLAIYHGFATQAFREVPEIRETRYQDALKYLVALSEGEVETMLPRLTKADGKPKTGIIFGSEPKRKYILE